MKVVAHANEDALLVEATSGKTYVISVYHDSSNPKEIKELVVALQREGRTTDEDKEIAAMVFDKHTEGKGRWGQGTIDLADLYQHMTPEQRKMLYDEEE